MPAPPPTRFRRDFWALLIPAAVGLAYAGGHLGWYGDTPLGQVPVLDEQENLAFAEAIAGGLLPPEPFYRAPGYALALAGLRGLGVPSAGLFYAALILGTALHGLNALLAAGIARTWFGRTAALLAGLLFALHPVLVHYATQALDATPALTLFLAGLWFVAPPLAGDCGNGAAAWRWSAASVAWAAATMMRPNYLLVWCTLPLLALVLPSRPQPRDSAVAPPLTSRARRGFFARIDWRCSMAALAGGLVFGSFAVWQWRVSNVAGFLPWQGPYNLWAANQPGAHGRYYVQRLTLPAALAAQNPARAESFLFFQAETGRPAADLRELNAHWRTRFLDYVREHPLAWLGQLGRKGYALLNNWEQYNNKTFAFHQARSPWLRWNPLCWGAIFVLGVAGAARLSTHAPRAAAALALVGAAGALSALLFFVSARFRLPLAALAVILAGGALAAPAFWRSWPRGRQLTLGAALAGAAALTFSHFDRVNDRATFVQDHALLARAASTTGDDAVAWPEALAALALQPGHRDAQRIAVATYFNRLISGIPLPVDEAAWFTVCSQLLAEPVDDALELRVVAAVAWWRHGQREAALAEWRRLGLVPSALASRLLVGDLAVARVDVATWPLRCWAEPLVRLAALQCNLAPPADVKLGGIPRADEIVRRLFASPALATPVLR